MLTAFRHMGVLVYNEPTYYYHQRHLLIPTIISFWRKYQTKLLDSLKGKEVVLAGDSIRFYFALLCILLRTAVFAEIIGHQILIQTLLFLVHAVAYTTCQDGF